MAHRPAVRCALYARVSTDQQAEKYGLASQLTELRAKADRHGYTVVGEFVDDGVSGATLDRPRLDALRELVRGRAVDVVMAHASDRISRRLVDLLLVVEEVRRHAARVEFVTHTPDDSDEGRLQEQILASIAEFERAKIRERTSRGSREKARRGKSPTGAPPFGYRRDESALGALAVDEAEAAVVRRVFEWVADGVALRAVVARLDAHGIAPRRAARWSRTSVRTIIHADVYAGVGIYNRRDESGPDGWTLRAEAEWIRYRVTPIVPAALVERARAQLERNKSLLRGRPSPRFWLLGGLLVCGACGRRMHGDARNPTAVYRCEGRTLPPDERCRFTRPADALDARMWAGLVAVIRDPDALRSTAKASALGIHARRVDAATEHAEVTRALAKVKKARERLLDLYVEGRLERTELDAREPALKAEADRLARALEELTARMVAGEAEADRHAAVARYCALVARGIERLDDGQRQALVRKLVTRVVAHVDRAEVEGVLPLTTPGDGAKAAKSQEGEMVTSGQRLDHFSLRLTVPLAGRA